MEQIIMWWSGGLSVNEEAEEAEETEVGGGGIRNYLFLFCHVIHSPATTETRLNNRTFYSEEQSPELWKNVVRKFSFSRRKQALQKESS